MDHPLAFTGSALPTMPAIVSNQVLPGALLNSSLSTTPMQRTRRVKACDYCHQEKAKCTNTPSGTCENCAKDNINCTYDRPVKKRGPIPAPKTQPTFGEKSETYGIVFQNAIPEKWKRIASINARVVQDLVALYFKIVYPIYPFFHRLNTITRIKIKDHLKDLSVFANVMSMCALVSMRVRDGGVILECLGKQYTEMPRPDIFFQATKDSIPGFLNEMRGLNWLRTCACLVLYGIHAGQLNVVQEYMSLYHTLVSIDGLQDEMNWPEMDFVEKELRRRLHWSMYSLEIFNSIVLGTSIRSPEAMCHVSYPCEIDDEYLTNEGYHQLIQRVPTFPKQIIKDSSSWLHGWNFVTDLYRVLEHAMDGFHRRRPRSSEIMDFSSLFNNGTTHPIVVFDSVKFLYLVLPSVFRDSTQYVISPLPMAAFQAANITATLQLVKMVLSTSEGTTGDQKSILAQDLLDEFENIPSNLLRSISSPVIRFLADMSVFKSLINGSTSESEDDRAHRVLVRMIQLLETLERGGHLGRMDNL